MAKLNNPAEVVKRHMRSAKGQELKRIRNRNDKLQGTQFQNFAKIIFNAEKHTKQKFITKQQVIYQ